MEPRNAFQNIYHRQFWSPIHKVLGPYSDDKLFSKYYHYCHIVYIKCFIIIHLHTELYHYRKNQKKNWMDAKINHTCFWTQSERKCPILGLIEVFSKYWKLWLLSCPSSLKIWINIAKNIASSNLLLVSVYTYKIKLVKSWILQS